MGIASQYWTFVRLDPGGNCKSEEIAAARTFFQQQFPQTIEQSHFSDAAIQAQLFTLLHMPEMTVDSTQHQLAERCLRCFISNQITQVCTSLANQFGNYYGFRLQDLLPVVLDDDLRSPQRPYLSLAAQILQSFNPEAGSLTTWTIRLVRQHRELNHFLLEHGLYLLSDWAILNDTKPERLRRVLSEIYQLSASEVDQSCVVLESYRAVYLSDRLKQRSKGPCVNPTDEQLFRISQLVQEKMGKALPPSTVFSQLSGLAKRLRQYRISVRGGPLPTQPIEHAETSEQMYDLPDQFVNSLAADEQTQFLTTYQQAFQSCLDQALEQVVHDRVHKSKTPEQANHFLTALQLFHCQHLSMTAIAPQVGLRSQDNVTRLLKLKEFRADVRRWMLKYLRDMVLKTASNYVDPDRLEQLDNQIEMALHEQIEALMQEDAKQSKTPKDFVSGSIFARRLCEFLDRYPASTKR